MNYKKRIKQVKKFLKQKDIDALLVTQPENRRYLSGFTDGDHGIGETSGVLLIQAKGKTYFLTDFRYKVQADQEIKDAEIMLYPKGLISLLGSMLPDLGIKKLAFESHYTLHSMAKRLRGLAKKGGFKLHPTTDVIEKMREIKDREELSVIRQSVLLNEQVFTSVLPKIAPSMSELDLALLIEATMKKKGATGPSFSSIVASGKNSALPHAIPTSKKIARSQPLTIDMGLILNGYCSDMTRSFIPGKKVTKKYQTIHRIVREAQLAGMEAIKPGANAADVDKAARDIIDKAGYGEFFGHALGHGVGLAVHEAPRLSGLSKTVLEEGMVITVEPGIYIPGWGGIRLENMIAVTKKGYENLNANTTWLDI